VTISFLFYLVIAYDQITKRNVIRYISLAYKVNVKWSANKYTLDLDPAKPPLEFKAALMSLTNIPPEKMKLMLKGKLIPDDKWPVSPQNNAQFMLLASPDSVIKPPTEKVLFEEDLNDEQLAKAVYYVSINLS
jgi:ubiquitin carboxyl-terminal hydrolase 14